MIINKIKLTNYRNYDSIELDLNNKLNILIGDNAHGKTNILEAIYVLSITKSYLNINDKNLIKFDKGYSIIEASILSDNINKKLKVLLNSKGKQVLVNGKEIKKLSDYISNLKIIIFSPDNIRMIKEGPSVRRKFLNVELSQNNNKYVKVLMDYNNIICQKNEYLKKIDNINSSYLDILNDKICELGVYIIKCRDEFIKKINIYISDIFNEITGINGLKVKYLSNIDIIDDNNEMTNNFKNKIISNKEKEFNYKVSLIGPHRDDFIFILNNKNLALYGSQGQMRCAILSLKLAEVKLFCSVSNDFPILLLDDIFSELDVDKKNNLIKYINDDVQTIITTTDINLIDKELVEKASVFKIKDAKVYKEK